MSFFRRFSFAVGLTVGSVTTVSYFKDSRWNRRDPGPLVQMPSFPRAMAAEAPSCQEKFNKFASLNERGEIYMTFPDFVLSLWRPADASGASMARDAVRAINACSKELTKLFDLFDFDGDKKLSYPEYCILHTILASTPHHIDVAFKMFDTDLKGALSVKQFDAMLRALVADPTVQLSEMKDSGIVKYLFGIDSSKNLKQADFERFISRFRSELLRSEFDLADTQKLGRLSLSQMRRLVYQKGASKVETLQVEMPGDLKETKRKKKLRKDKLKRSATSFDDLTINGKSVTGGADVEDYLAVTHILQVSDCWSPSMSLYINGEGEDAGDRAALGRALAICGIKATPRQKDLFFKMFDLDDSGSISPDELEAVAQGRTTFFAKHKADFSEPKRNRLQEWVYCMQQR